MLREGGMPPPGARAPVGSNPLTVAKDLDGGLGGTHIDIFLLELVGDTVIVFVEFDVVVDVDPRFLPDRIFVGLFRQRLEDRLVQFLKKLTAGATEVFHLPGVEPIEQLADGSIQIGQVEEGVVA